ncbi:hypothetical protein ABN789_004878 [Salmonella enterica]
MVQHRKIFAPCIVEKVCPLVCDNPGIYRQQLTDEINKIHHVSRVHLDDILFYLRISRGLYAERTHGIHRDYEVFCHTDRRER